MGQTEKMRAFIIKFLYILIWTGLIYCALKYALPLFMPFVLAFIIAFLLKPLINLITSKTPFGRKPVAVVVLTLVYLIAGGLLVLLGSRLFVFLADWFGRLPNYYRNTIEPAIGSFSSFFDNFFAGLDPSLNSFLDMAGESLSNAISNIVSAVSSGAVDMLTNLAGGIPWFVAAFVLTVIASFFFVVDYYTITSFITKQMPKRVFDLFFLIKDFVVNTLFRFARAYGIIIFITFAEIFAGLLVLGLKPALPIAILTALVDILPVLGTGTIMLPWAVYLMITGQWFQGIGLVVLYIAITFIRQIIEPRIVGRQIGLYPLLTLICMFIGARLFGFWGLFGFPITLVVIIHLNRVGEIRLFKE